MDSSLSSELDISGRGGEPAVDVEFDTRSDAPPGTDIDQTSQTLRRFHQLLWSKPLPSGHVFKLEQRGRSSYLIHESELGVFDLSSDFFAAWHRKLAPLWSQLPKAEFERQERLARSVGGYIVFPCRTVNRKQTINMRRATHHRVGDRFDLALECIRRHYKGEPSPLSDVLGRYQSFFNLFESFDGYLDFFYLRDAVKPDGNLKFFWHFDDFASRPLPSTIDDYRVYRSNVLTFVAARNLRIRSSWAQRQLPTNHTEPG